MTREKEIRMLKTALYSNYCCSQVEKESCLKAIIALELDSFIDKIKVEIDQNASKSVFGTKYIFVNRVNQIIDKYKTKKMIN